jgi:hypothetical protein
MIVGVLTFLKNNLDKFAGIPALLKAIQSLEGLVADIKIKTQELHGTMAGKTAAKHAAEDALIEVLVPVGNALFTIGKAANQHDVMEHTDITERGLRRLRDTDLAATGEVLSKLAQRFSTELAEYGYNAEKIVLIRTRTDAFMTSIGVRESGVGEHVGARLTLIALYDQVDELLADTIDRLMELVKVKEPQLYEQYFSLRTIKWLGIVHKKETAKAEAAAPVLK